MAGQHDVCSRVQVLTQIAGCGPDPLAVPKSADVVLDIKVKIFAVLAYHHV
jgi:hypothetical protein